MLVKGAPDGWWDLKKPCKKPCRTSRVHGTWIKKKNSQSGHLPQLLPRCPQFGFHPGAWFNIKMLPYQYVKSYCRDKMINWLYIPTCAASYIESGLAVLRRIVSSPQCFFFLFHFFYTGEMTTLYWKTHTCLKFSPVHDFVSPWNMTDLFLHDI